MAVFFYICEYLQISPRDFFDEDSKNPEKLNEIIANLQKLSDNQLNSISEIVRGLVKK